MNYFTSEPVTDRLTRICTPFGVCTYLVLGDEKALLLDTGMGIGDLKGFVESLTDLPYDVALTHGHCDHAGGASQFEIVFLNPIDFALEKRHATIEHRMFDVYNGPFPVPDGTKKEDFVPQRTAPYQPLSENDRTDLGGVRVSFIAVPGHTRGCLVPLIEEDRIAIIGDALGETTLMHFEESTTIEEYKQSLIYLDGFSDRFDRTLRFHGTYESDKRIVKDCIALCDQILNGVDAKIPVEFHEVAGRLAREKKHPGYFGNIVYNPAKIRAAQN